MTGQSGGTEPYEVTIGSSPASTEPPALDGLRYVVIGELGRGAMGRVLRAYDPRLQREVALKWVGGEGLVRSNAERLVAEAHALARVSHPNVVAVFDVERSDAGAVVLVMELVVGRDLEHWLRDEKTEWKQVVEVFCQAGRGLAAAHAAGVLHRDFKPANVMLSEDGAVKVADFGLAKSTSTATVGSDDVRLTQVGSTVGTPLYMAPEQHAGPDLTAAADQFAFCGALYRALTGQSPFDEDDLVRSKLQPQRTWPAGSVPAVVKRVVERGMQPRPEDRWPSMTALVDALHPAREKSNRRAYGAMLALAAVGVGALAAAFWIEGPEAPCQAARQELAGTWDDARRRAVADALVGLDDPVAQLAWERARTELDHHADAWARMYGEACEATAVRGEQPPEVLDLRMRCLRRARVEMRTIVDQLAEADEKVALEVHRLLAGLRPVSECADADTLKQEIAPPLPAETEAVEKVRVKLAEARAARAAGRYEQSMAILEEAKSAAAGLRYGPLSSEIASEEGDTADDLGDYARSEEAFRSALREALRWRHRDVIVHAAANLAYAVGYRQALLPRGLQYIRIAEASARGASKLEYRVAVNLGPILERAGRYVEAERQHRRALAYLEATGEPSALAVAWRRVAVGNALGGQARYREAEEELRRALELIRGEVGGEHPNLAAVYGNLANVVDSQGRYDEGAELHRRDLALRERFLGPDHPRVAMARSNYASVLRTQGKYEEAEALSREALAMLVKALGPRDHSVGVVRMNLAEALREQARYEEAGALYQDVIETFAEALGDSHPNVAGSRYNYAKLLEQQGRTEAAEAQLRLAIRAWTAQLGVNHASVAKGRTSLAKLLIDVGRAQEALEHAEAAWGVCQRTEVLPLDCAVAGLTWARALWTTGSQAAARTAARAALAVLEDSGADDRKSTAVAAEMERWLDRHVVVQGTRDDSTPF